jgi:hypothetical protein
LLEAHCGSWATIQKTWARPDWLKGIAGNFVSRRIVGRTDHLVPLGLTPDATSTGRDDGPAAAVVMGAKSGARSEEPT